MAKDEESPQKKAARNSGGSSSKAGSPASRSASRPSGKPSGRPSGKPSGERSSSSRASGKPSGERSSSSRGSDSRSSSERPSARASGKPSSSRSSSERPYSSRGSAKPSTPRPAGGRSNSGSTSGAAGSRRDAESRPPRESQRAGAPRSDRPRSDRPRDDRPRVPAGPPIPDDVTGRELDRAVRAELSGLAVGTATEVARNLVMVARLLDDDPDQAYLYAQRVRALSQRLAVAREAMGLAAYHRGLWAEARSELRAFQRMSGSQEHLAIIADCERGLGHPERALELAGSANAAALDPADRAELRIVAAGARADLGQPEAAVVTLKCAELNSRSREPWVARLRYAYADALLVIGRHDEAREWFERAAEGDLDGWTDAADRVAELDGFVVADLFDESDSPEDAGQVNSDSEPIAPSDQAEDNA